MFYPKFSPDVEMNIDVVLQKLGQDPGYLDSDECPYGGKLRGYLKRMVVQDVDVDGDVDGDVEWDWADPFALGKQIDKALRDREKMGQNLGTLEPNEKIAYFKAKSGLIEKLVGLKERVVNIKEVNDFRSIVIETLEQVCSADQITEFRNKLGTSAGTGTSAEVSK